MRKGVVIALATVFVCASAMAQEEGKEKKKGGGFLKAIESNTGLKVSNEALFVYPEVGVWKITVESCVGNKELGSVQLKVNVTKISGNSSMGTQCELREAKTTDGTVLGFQGYAAEPLYHFKIGETHLVTFVPIGGVPDGAKSIDVKFTLGYRGYEAEGRRIPIEWK